MTARGDRTDSRVVRYGCGHPSQPSWHAHRAHGHTSREAFAYPGLDQGPGLEVGSVAEVEIGIGKSGRRAYGLDDIAIVPSRRTRDPEDIDVSWQIDAYGFDLPLLGSAMDSVVSPRTAIELGRLGGLGVLNLEGLWTRYDDPEPLLERSPASRRRSPPPGCRRSTSSPSSRS